MAASLLEQALFVLYLMFVAERKSSVPINSSATRAAVAARAPGE